MIPIPDKPDGSTIKVLEDPDSVTLSWSLPNEGPRRYLMNAVFLAALCIWAPAWGLHAPHMVNGGLINGLFNGGQDLLLGIWFVGMTLVGIGFVGRLGSLFRPVRPESLRLGVSTFQYDPGREPPSLMKPLFSSNRGKPLEVLKANLGAFSVETVHDRRWLVFNHGAERVEIGAGLRGPEREWLLSVLETWRRA
jgi:hypothetical protein